MESDCNSDIDPDDGESWHLVEDPTEEEFAGASEKLHTMVIQQLQSNSTFSSLLPIWVLCRIYGFRLNLRLSQPFLISYCC